MEKQETKSKWDDLARELGADVADESLQQPSSLETNVEQIPTQPSEPAEPRVKPRPTPPKRAATNWEALNNQLGLEPPPAPPEPSPPFASEPARRMPTPAETGELPHSEARERKRHDARPDVARERPRREEAREARRERPRRHEREDRRAKRSGREEARVEREPRRRREEPRERSRRESEDQLEGVSTHAERPQTPPGSALASPEEQQEAEDLLKAGRRAAEAVEASAEEQAVEQPKSASVSLWHKIFGLPAEQSAKLSGSSVEEEAKRPTSETREPTTRQWEQDLDRPSAEERDDADTVTEPARRREEPPVDESQRRRPRRRRRGRQRDEERSERTQRSRSPRSAASEKRQADESFDFDDEFGGAPAGFDTLDSSGAVAEDAEEDASEARERVDQPAQNRSAGHRNIPSWEDAIGAIVDHNLQSRTHRHQPTGTSSRGGPSRGRSRGRRRKKS